MAETLEISGLPGRPSTMETIRGSLAARRRRETGLKAAGLVALGFAFTMLGLVFLSLISTGYHAFTQTHVTLDVFVDPEMISEDRLPRGDFDDAVEAGLAERVGGVESKTERRALAKLLSDGAQFALRDMVVADPGLIGQRVTLTVPTSDSFDQLNKGLIDRATPEENRRVTDAQTLAIVEQTLGYELNEHLTNEIERLGGRAINLNFKTTNVLFGEKLLLEEPGSEPIDLGFVGQVTRVERQTIESLTYTEQIPVIPSMCIDETGQKYNVNADTAAMAVAEALGAEKLIFISDVNGVRRDKDDPESVIHSMTADEARELIRTGVIAGGMIPKVEACLATLNRGVGKVHIIDGQLRHSLLLEIYTTAGVGTEIVQRRNTSASRIAI